MQCPGCGYERKESDKAPEWQCPECGIVYHKHPDYKAVHEYELQITCTLRPRDEDIKPNIIYLYLSDENALEYALVDEHVDIKRAHLFDSELGGYSSSIVNVLQNANASLNKEQEDMIFDALSKRGYQKSAHQHVDKKIEYHHLLDIKNKKKRRTILIGFLISVIAIFYYFYSSITEPDIKKSIKSPGVQNAVLIKTPVENGSKSHETVNLQARGINLSFLSSKLYVVNALAQECRAICQAHKEVDESCNKANSLMGEIYSQIGLYKAYVNRQGIDTFNSQDQQMIFQINQYLEAIPKEIEVARSLCNRSNSSVIQQKIQSKTVDFLTAGIDLNILYSKVYTASNEIRSCRLHCEAGSQVSTNCSMFVILQKEYKSDIENLFAFINNLPNSSRSQDISAEDKRYINQIVSLLDEIEQERTKIVDCVSQLRQE